MDGGERGDNEEKERLTLLWQAGIAARLLLSQNLHSLPLL